MKDVVKRLLKQRKGKNLTLIIKESDLRKYKKAARQNRPLSIKVLQIAGETYTSGIGSSQTVPDGHLNIQILRSDNRDLGKFWDSLFTME